MYRRAFLSFLLKKSIHFGRKSCIFIILILLVTTITVLQFFLDLATGVSFMLSSVSFGHRLLSIALLLGTTICSSLILSVPPPALESATASVGILARSPYAEISNEEIADTNKLRDISTK